MFKNGTQVEAVPESPHFHKSKMAAAGRTEFYFPNLRFYTAFSLIK